MMKVRTFESEVGGKEYGERRRRRVKQNNGERIKRENVRENVRERERDLYL